jgi:hypothetical protein
LVNPVLTACHVVPLLLERKTPSPANMPSPTDAAKRFVPLTARDRILVLVRPVVAAAQLVPLFVDRYTPPPHAAKRFGPLTARAVVVPGVGNPVFAAVQFAPLFVDRYTPAEEIPAKRFVPLTAKE